MTKPYPWFFDLGSRPVVVEQEAGGAMCYAFDPATGNLVASPDILDQLAGAPALDEDAFARALATRRAGLVRALGERLCRARSGAETDLRGALGIPLEPEPIGASAVHIRGGEPSLAKVELELPAGTLLRSDLDAVLGQGRVLPRTGPFRPYIVSYEVAVPGAPHRCTVFASVADDPDPEAAVTNVALRLDRAAS